MPKTALYRLYDNADQLLYVGITGNLKRRWYAHEARKRWWTDVARKTVEWFENRELAEAEEKRIIREETPPYNVKGVPGRVKSEPEVRRHKPGRKRPAAPLYERVVAELERQGKTMDWLQRRSGVPGMLINAWETQPQPVLVGQIGAVADALGIDKAEAAQLGAQPGRPFGPRPTD